jgi:hypothetical protein
VWMFSVRSWSNPSEWSRRHGGIAAASLTPAVF